MKEFQISNFKCRMMAMLFAWLVILAVSVRAFAINKPNTVIAQTSCVTAECHAKVKDYKVLHGPVNVNACDACHKLTNPVEHKFEYTRPKTEQCTFCHTLENVKNAPVVHKPVMQNDCLSCHDPHGGKTAKFTRGNSMREMCAKCHKDVVGEKQHIHGPVAAGACGACHQAHASQNKNLLVATGKDLCFTCHTEMKTQLAAVKFPHKALEKDCESCHDPHASDFAKQIKQPPVDLCVSCHEHEKIKLAMASSHKHSSVTEGKACLNCHTPHGGDLGKLMKDNPLNICMQCHNDKIEKKDENGKTIKTVASIAEAIDPKLVKHGPIKDGNCAGCHDVHGSEQSRLLKKPYPETFYQPFALEKYDLCFTCHEKQLVLSEKTEGLTNFRNGTMNLHFLHVNKNDRGRSCRACHATHASKQVVLVRDSVPYGNWLMPLNYNKTDTGGSCSPGCHKPFSYDRANPVDYTPPATQPATQPSPAPTVVGTPATSNDPKDNKS